MAITFDRYMQRCLYDPDDGFYTTDEGSAGRRGGDFITSPEVGPLFAEVLARALDTWWEELGCPDPFCVFDAGTGPGTLARMLDRAPGRSKDVRRVRGFDIADVAGSPPEGLAGSIVVANELLDNIPFRIVEREPQGWAEVHVVQDAESGWHERLETPAPALTSRQMTLLEPLDVGARVPLLDRAADWVRQVLAQEPAKLVAFDYGAATTAELGRRGGWLRTYRRHQQGHDPYREPGRWDITTDVAVDQLPPPDEVIDQARMLRRWGIDELVEEGRRHWQEHAAAPDVAALKMRSRVTEADALLDPDGLGSWLVCTWTNGA